MADKILLIDDEDDFRDLICTFLKFNHYEVVPFSDGRQVMAHLQKDQFVAVVTDLMMPGMSGFQLIDMIRQESQLKELPIIMLTAKELSVDERKRVLQSHVYFLQKPFQPLALLEKIREAVQIKSTLP